MTTTVTKNKLKTFTLKIDDREIKFIQQNTQKKSNYAKLQQAIAPLWIDLFWGFQDKQYRWFAVMCNYDSVNARKLANYLINKSTIPVYKTIFWKQWVLFIVALSYSKQLAKAIQEQLLS